MEIEVSLVGCFVFDCRPDEAHEIVVSVLLAVGCEEEDGGHDCSDLEQVGIVRLAVNDPEVFLCRFEERGYFSRRHIVGDGLLALSWMACRRCLITNQLY